MTRALILAVQVPFVQGGAERLVEQLQQQIIARGHYAEVLRLPFKWYPYDQLLREAAIWRSLVLADDGPQGFDVVIPTRFPTYLVQHPRKVVWLLHQHRQVYDLLNTPLTDVADTAENDQLRRVLYELDNAYLPQCSRLFTISRRM